MRIQEELAASKLERDKAVRELERVMEEDAEVGCSSTCHLKLESPKLGMFARADALADTFS